MEQTEKKQVHYKKIENISAYVQKLAKEGANLIIAKKWMRIMARKGTPGEKVISWSVTADGDLIMEKEAEVGQDAETGENDWIATKIGKDESVLVDEHGNKNEWIITDTVFWQKYRQDQEHPGYYVPVGVSQTFLRLPEAITLRQWGEESMRVDAGGYINVTDKNNIYVISQRDFEDTYEIEQDNLLAEVIFDMEEMSVRLFTAHMELGDHHFKVPDCPVTYNGDDRDYVMRLYREWFYEYPFDSVSKEEGRLLSKHISINFLSQGSAYMFQEAIGDYYLSENNAKFALTMYELAYHLIGPGNYSYLKKWTLLLKMADVLETRFTGREEETLRVLEQLFKILEQYSKEKEASLYRVKAVALKAMVLEKTGKKKGYDFLIQQRRTFEREKPSFHLFQICLELAEAFQEYEELGRYLLKLAKKNSEILPKLALMNEKYDRWMFGEQEIENSEELRKKLQDCYLRLLRLRYVYGHTK